MIANILIIMLLMLGVYLGYQRGLITVVADLVGLALALTLASLTYRWVGHILATQIRLIPSFGEAMGYLLVVAVVELAYAISVNRLLERLPKRILEAPLNRATGTVANLVRVLILIMIGLVVYAALPIAAAQKQAVTNAAIPRQLLSYSGSLQQAFNEQFGGAIHDTINFFTVEPETDKTVELGFSTTNVSVDTVDEDQMLILVNHERTSRGLSALTMNIKAQTVARSHSRDMFARGYFSHVTPEGLNPFQRMAQGGVSFDAAGENLALAPTLDLAHNGLMNSPGHRANILSPDYHTVGIGIIDGGPYGLMVTQDFTD